MGKSIVVINKENLLVSSSDLAIGFGIEHKRVKEIVKKYQSEFEEWGEVLGELRPKPKGSKGGRTLEDILLNEPQATYLTTLLSNNNRVRKFKRFLTNEFFKQRTALNNISAQKQNSEWIEQRNSGKLARRQGTDGIQFLITYAKDNGSKNYVMYYPNITKMQYKILFPEKWEQFGGKIDNFRDCLDRRELNILEVSDNVIRVGIEQGIKLQKPYKEIYQDCKLRTEGLALSLGILPFMLCKKQKDVS